MEFNLPRFLLASDCEDAGKFFLALGLAQDLRAQGFSCACCILGPNLLQAALLRRTTNRFVRCIDPNILSRNQIIESLEQLSKGADVTLILGSSGLFDSAPGTRYSDASFAAATQTPIVLVVDASKYREGVAPLIRGFYSYSDDLSFLGSVVNRVEGFGGSADNARDFFKRVFENAHLGPPLGVCFRSESEKNLPGRVVTQRHNVISLPRQVFVDAGAAASNLASEQILEGGVRAPALGLHKASTPAKQRRTRIAVSDDSCFQICFQDNLHLLRHYGAELVTFSPLTDERLPDNIGGVYITGAFLSDYESELQANSGIKTEILNFYKSGGVLYAEGAGAAFLARKIHCSEQEGAIDGVGILSGIGSTREGLAHYVEALLIDDTVLGGPGTIIKGYHSGDWVLSEEDTIPKTMRINETSSHPGIEGYSPGPQAIITFSLLHFGSSPEVAERIVDAAEVHCSLTRDSSDSGG